MKLAFYKAPGGVFNEVIRLKTKSIYSHVELVFENVIIPSWLVRVGDVNGKVCYSSADRDGGVRFKYIDLNPTQWDLISLIRNESEILNAAGPLIGFDYDYEGIVEFVVPTVQHNRRKRFCSEVCAELLGFPEPWKISPAALHSMDWVNKEFPKD